MVLEQLNIHMKKKKKKKEIILEFDSNQQSNHQEN